MSILRVDEVSAGAGGRALDIISCMAKTLIDFDAELFTPPNITRSTNVSSVTDAGVGINSFDHINFFAVADYATTSVSLDLSVVDNAGYAATSSCYFRGTAQIQMNSGQSNADTLESYIVNSVTALGELADA